MFIDLSIFIQLILWGAIKATIALPRNSRDAIDNPSNHDYILYRLPYADNVNPCCLEQNLANKPQCPKYSFVFTDACETIERTFEDNIISGKSKRYVTTEKVLKNKPAQMNMPDYIKIYTGALVYAIMNYTKYWESPKNFQNVSATAKSVRTITHFRYSSECHSWQNYIC